MLERHMRICVIDPFIVFLVKGKRNIFFLIGITQRRDRSRGNVKHGLCFCLLWLCVLCKKVAQKEISPA